MTDASTLSFWHNRKIVRIYKCRIGYRWQVHESTLYRAVIPVTGDMRHSGWHLTAAGARRTAIRATRWTAPWERRIHRHSRSPHGRSLR